MIADPLKPLIIEVDATEEAGRIEARPQVIITELTERVHPIQPTRTPVIAPVPAHRGGAVVPLGFAGLGVFFAGWLAIDAIGWISAAFDRSTALGVLAATAMLAGVAGMGVVIGREITSLFRLRSVEAIQRRFRLGLDQLRAVEARQAIRDILAVVPREEGGTQAIEAFQRQAQAHHTATQQIEILARIVIGPLDRRAQAHVRTAVLRAFGITAISPTALSDSLFFLACGVRMVRAIATCYGHRPTATATIHLLRRLVFEAGKLGAVDIASTTLMQRLGGAVTERVATSAADALYAAYRMARLGIVVMELCRPIPFRDDDVPSVASLVGNVVRRRPEQGP